jgi:hypothetical protein
VRVRRCTGRPVAKYRFKVLSEIMQASGLYSAIWRQTVSVQTVDCIRGIVTASGIGGCRIIPPTETGSRRLSRFAAGGVWRPLARTQRSWIRSPRMRVRLLVAPHV